MTMLHDLPRTAGAAPVVPPARRRPAPSLRDGRLLGGVVLVLGSIVLGARVVGAASRTTGVLALTRDLPAGHVVAAADLTEAEVHRDGGVGDYVTDRRAALGRRLDRPVGRGELLPKAALAVAGVTDTADVPVTVDAGRAPDLASGDLVDVWSTFATVAGGDDKGCTTVMVARGLEVTGQLDATGSAQTVVLAVPAGSVGAVVHAEATTTVVLTRHEASTGDSATATSQIAGLTPVGVCGSPR